MQPLLREGSPVSHNVRPMHILVATLAASLFTACSSVVVVADNSGASSSTAASTTGADGAGTGSAVAATSTTGSGGSPATSTTGTGEAPAPDEAVTYQINAAHTGALENDSLTPPLTKRWTLDLGAHVSYPLIAAGRVFVTVGSSQVPAKLVALDQETGGTAWGPVELGGTHARSHAVYDQGNVFTLNSDGQLRAFEAATGNELWSVQLPAKNGYFSSAPTAMGGKLFIVGVNGSSQFFAVSEATGALLWTRIEPGAGSWNPPVASGTGVYIACWCGNVCSFDPKNGKSLWPPSTSGCQGSDGHDAVLFEGQLYIREVKFGPDPVFDAATGMNVGSFEHDSAVAFHKGYGFFVSKGDLTARSIPSMKQIWELKGDGAGRSKPIVVNGHVYFTASSTAVAAVDEQTGAPVWSTYLDLGEPSGGGEDSPMTGLGAGGGALLVPWGNYLVALW